MFAIERRFRSQVYISAEIVVARERDSSAERSAECESD